LHIGESRDSGFDASHRPGMTGLLADIAVILEEVVAFLTAAFENHGAHGLVACETR
jgi:hypothetical protein